MLRFFVVGPQKTGTAWLRGCLGQHPDIYVPDRVNELFFFDRYFDRGLSWYAGYFEGCEGATAVGEVAPTYFGTPGVELRIRDTYPDARIITSFRNPVDRAWSMYRYLLQKGDTRAPFRRAVEEFPGILQDGLYARHLARYLDVFPNNLILNLIYEDVVRDAGPALRELFRFLHVKEDFVPSATEERVNEGRTVRSFLMSRIIHRTARALHRQGMHDIVHVAKRIGMKGLVLRQGTRMKMSDEERAWCEAYYREDVAALSEMLELDLHHVWFRASDLQPLAPSPAAQLSHRAEGTVEQADRPSTLRATPRRI